MQTIFRKKLYLSTLLLVIIALIGAGFFQGEALAALGFGGSGNSLAAIDNPADCSVSCTLYAEVGSAYDPIVVPIGLPTGRVLRGPHARPHCAPKAGPEGVPEVGEGCRATGSWPDTNVWRVR